MCAATSSVLRGRRWQFGWCEYREISRSLLVHGQAVDIEARPLDVLVHLLEHGTETVGKEELLTAVWGNTAPQSLTTAVSKLRGAFGGPRDAILINIAGVGYRMAVPVVCTTEEEPRSSPTFSLAEGKAVPGNEDWSAVRMLGRSDASPVWLGQKDDEQRVFKFANDGVRLRALQREATLFRVFRKAFGDTPSWGIKMFRWGFEEEPFYTESEFGGVDLLRWSISKEFLEMSLGERVQLAAQIADAVAAAHSLSILHNDLKPTNILVTSCPQRNPTHSYEQRWQVKVIDFGVASLLDTERLQQMEITDYGMNGADDKQAQSSPAGTAMYQAPELLNGGTPSQLVDVYALGLLLYQIVVGNFLQPLAPGWEAGISDPLLRIDIAKAAEVDPALRLSSAGELAVRLHTLEERRSTQHQVEADQLRARLNEELLLRARIRRPWVIVAVSVLVLGFCISSALFRLAVRQRNLANARNITLSAMYEFLAQDLLGQSNPYLTTPVPSHGLQETLLEAVGTARRKIDGRFWNAPEIAGRLHVTIADAFKSRTQYVEADQEYLTAEERFRLAEGPLSENALLTEFKRENAQLSSRLPGAITSAQNGYKVQQTLVAKLRKPSAELQAWNTLIEASFIGFGDRPQDAVPLLSIAIQKAQAAPGLDPALITTMKARICGFYVRLQDGPNLEQASRELRDGLAKRNGSDSPTLVLPEMYIQEALYLERRYRDTVEMGEQNYRRFSRILGPQHELTLATLANRAAAEGELGDYEAALRDDLKLYTAERSNPSGRRLEQGSLADAAMYECHAGHFREGIEHARQVIRESGPGPLSQPMFAEGARFTLAECLISKQESKEDTTKNADLSEANRLLEQFDFTRTDQMSGGTDYATWLDVAKARLAFLRGDRPLAFSLATREVPVLAQQGASLYEKQAVKHLLEVLNQKRSS